MTDVSQQETRRRLRVRATEGLTYCESFASWRSKNQMDATNLATQAEEWRLVLDLLNATEPALGAPLSQQRREKP